MTTPKTNAQKLTYLLTVKENLFTMITGTDINDYEVIDSLERTYQSILRAATILEGSIRKEQLATGVTREQLVAIAREADVAINDIIVTFKSSKMIIFRLEDGLIGWTVSLTKTGKVRKNSLR